MSLFQDYIKLHEKTCNLSHKYEDEFLKKEDHFLFIKKAKLECLKHVIQLVDNKCDYFKCMYYGIIGSDDMEKIDYFFSYDHKEETLLFNSGIKLDLIDMLYLSLHIHSFNFVKKVLCDFKVIISGAIFSFFCRQLILAFSTNNKIYQEFYDLEVWNYAEDSRYAKRCMIYEVLDCFDRSYKNIDFKFLFKEEWWVNFFIQNKSYLEEEWYVDLHKSLSEI